MSASTPHIAYFISPHGYGHASRAAAVMAALHRKQPATCFDIYTLVPKAFFEDSLEGPFEYHSLLSDIGLVQHDALHEDIPNTIQRLNAFLRYDPNTTRDVATQLQARKTLFVISDISPLGIHCATEAGISSVLIENFTWDWIYQAYTETHPAMRPHARYLHDIFLQADFHIQTQPLCAQKDSDLTTDPVAREPRTPTDTIRSQLNIKPGQNMILVSMGGIPEEHSFLSNLQQIRDCDFVIPGIGSQPTREGNTLTLPHHSEFYHPDLVAASSCVIGKVGYSTIAEVYHSRIPFGYVSRPTFRESPPLAAFISENMPSMSIPPESFRSGDWLHILPELLKTTAERTARPNGADQIAAFIETELPSARPQG